MIYLYRLENLVSHFIGVYAQDLQDQDHGRLWQFKQVLGKGSFGGVFRYTAADNQGAVVDDLALKVAQPGRDGPMPSEALVMAQTNAMDIDAFVYLRQFKMGGTIGTVPIELYYLEYCDYRDLASLKLSYMAFRKPVEEPFLCYLLSVFVEACTAMNTGPFRHHGSRFPPKNPQYRVGDILPESYMLHRDIKPVNIILTTPPDGRANAQFPAVRIGDLGMAEIIHPQSDRGKRSTFGGGTGCYMAPELRLARRSVNYQLGVQRRKSAAGRKVGSMLHSTGEGLMKIALDESVTVASDLWAFMVVIWELMTFRDIEELSRRVDARLWKVPIGKSRATMLDGDIMSSIASNASPYSDQLVSLIKNGLQLNPKDRMKLDQVKDHVEYGLKHSLRESGPVFDFSILTGELDFVSDLNHQLDDNFWSEFRLNAALRDEESGIGFPPGLSPS